MERFLLFYLTTALIIKEYSNKYTVSYPTREFFPQRPMRQLKFANIKGANNLPIVLEASAIGATPNIRQRKGMEVSEEKMYTYKNKMVVPTELLLELDNLRLHETTDPKIKSVFGDIYNDAMTLMEGARATHELLRCKIMTEGKVITAQNGANYTIDYQLANDQFYTPAKTWDDETAPILDDIQLMIDTATDRDQGGQPDAMMLSKKHKKNFVKNTQIINAIKAVSNITGDAVLTAKTVVSFLEGQFEMKFYFNDEYYTDDDGNTYKFWDEKKVTMWDSTRRLGETLTGPTDLVLLEGKSGYDVKAYDNRAFFMQSELITKPNINQETTVETSVGISLEDAAKSMQIMTVLA